MKSVTHSPSPVLRMAAYLIVALAVVTQLVRIMQVESTTGEVPFHSANDRSRWCTIAALAINGSYEIDDIIELRDPKTKRRTWYTIDLVRHRGSDGRQHFYSSKPPLLPTLVAGVYAVVRATTGASLMNDPFFVVRTMLVLVNLLPLVLFWWLFVRWLIAENLSEWATLVLTAFLAFGTFVSTFANTLNNHLPAAIAVGVSLWCLDRILLKQDARWRWFVATGFATSFGAANELPALSWVAAAGVLLLICDWKKALFGYAPALLPVAIAFFATNFWAHGEFKPAYAHRGLGDKILQVTLNDDDLAASPTSTPFVEALRATDVDISDQAEIRRARQAGVWELWDEATQQRFALRRDAAPPHAWGIYEWGDWYDYPNSYWTADRKQGVDRGEPNRAVYAMHCLVGHHGIFSLTPFWLMALAGLVAVVRSSSSFNIFLDQRLLLTTAILATSVVAIAFYLARPLEDRNYGGVTSGFRWSFWLTAPWIWLAANGMKFNASAWGRRIIEALLLASVFSATYPWSNPWTSPWIMQYWQYLGWIE